MPNCERNCGECAGCIGEFAQLAINERDSEIQRLNLQLQERQKDYELWRKQASEYADKLDAANRLKDDLVTALKECLMELGGAGLYRCRACDIGRAALLKAGAVLTENPSCPGHGVTHQMGECAEKRVGSVQKIEHCGSAYCFGGESCRCTCYGCLQLRCYGSPEDVAAREIVHCLASIDGCVEKGNCSCTCTACAAIRNF